MNRLLLLLCCLLVTAVAAELSYGQRDDHQNGQTLAADSAAAPKAPKPTMPATSSIDRWTTEALSRPLFAPDRRPAVRATTVDAGLPRLTGIIASASDAVAIFQPTGNGKPMTARHGQVVAGWAVTTIAGNSVSLQKANERLILRPAFDNPKGSSSANDQKEPRSRWEAAASTGVLRARWSNPQLQP